MAETVSYEVDSPAMMKVWRARDHFFALEASIAAWNNQREIIAPVRQSQEDPQVLEVFHPEDDEPLWHWSCLLGDGVHNLRSALDVLAWQMCHLDGAEPANPTKVYFPARRTSAGKKWSEQAKPLASMPQDFLDRMEAVQGWSQSSHHVRGRALELVHELDLEDKHRSLLEMSPLPERLSLEEITPWPDGLNLATAFTRPWMRLTIGGTVLPEGLKPGVLKIRAHPLVTLKDSTTLVVPLQRWLLVETFRVLTFVSSGELPTDDLESDLLLGREVPATAPEWMMPG